jgi:DNA-binding transcriptional ArsR family regulator
MAKLSATRATSSRGLAEAARRAVQLARAVTSPTRAEVVLMLARGERNVGEIAGSLGQLQTTVSHHLATLRHAGVIATRREDKWIHYRLTDRGRALAELLRGLGEEVPR